MSNLKNIIITGATSGLGLETAKKLAKNNNNNIILACRNLKKATKVKEEIIKLTENKNIKEMLLDTSSLTSVREFVQEFKKLNIKIDSLICNAGISPMHSGTTEDGFELVFATNYLGHFLLTNLLLPYMEANSQIINVTSDMHNPPGGIEWKNPEELAHPKEDDRKKYSYSKLGNIYFTYELDKRLRNLKSSITVNAFNPGMMATNFSGSHHNQARTAMVKLTMPERVGDLDKSSTALAEIITDDKYRKITCKYFDRSTEFINSSELSYNEENRIELWNKSVEFTKLKKEETINNLL